MDIHSNQQHIRLRNVECTDGDESDSNESVDSISTLDFSERTWKEDFTLVVENKKLYVSKAFLALSSPVFDRMFQSDFKEKNQTEMELPDKKVSDMRDFLRCIYPSIMADISDQNVFKVLPLAEEYQVSCLKSKCEAFLTSRLNEEISADYLQNMIKHAADYNMEDLLEKCILEVSKKPVKDVECLLKAVSLPSRTVCTIQDRMWRRLEQSEKDNTRLEAINRYLFSGLEAEEQLNIQRFQSWTGKSIVLTLSVEDLKRRNAPQSKRFKLLDTDASCAVRNDSSYGNTDSLKLDISFDANTFRGVRIVLGRVVIKNITKKNENYNTTFKMSFNRSDLKQSTILRNTSVIFDVAEGYIYYDKMAMEIHLLAEKESRE